MLVAMPWEIPANHPIVNHGSTASPSFGPGSFGKQLLLLRVLESLSHN